MQPIQTVEVTVLKANFKMRLGVSFERHTVSLVQL